MKQRAKTISLWRTSSPNLNEFVNLLELIPQAAILADVQHDAIFGANSKMLRLTAYSLNEICNIPLSHLLPQVNLTEILTNHVPPYSEECVEVSARNSQKIAAMLNLTPIDQDLKWLAISFETLNQRQQNQVKSQRQENLLIALEKITQANFLSNQKEYLQTIIQCGSTFTNSQILAVYETTAKVIEYERQKLNLMAMCGPQDSLPNEIITSNIHQMEEPSLWQPGKRISADLHRLARNYQLSYLASVPIYTTGKAMIGILIAADTKCAPDDDILRYLTILAHSLGSHRLKQESLKTLEKTYLEYQDSFSLYQKTIENVQDGVIFLSNDFTIQDMNPSAEHILGYHASEVIGEPAENVVIGAGNLHSALDLALDGIETPSLGNTNLHRRDGQAFAAHIQVLPVTSEDITQGILLLFRDLSKHHEIKIRTQQLEQRALLGELTAIFAHEIRNPINNMSFALQFLDLAISKDDPNRDHIERLRQNLDRLTHLMNTVFAFSKAANYQMVPVDLVNIIDKVLVRWQPHMMREKVEGHLQKPPELPLINGNAHALEQVFNNLFSNSIRAMQETHGGLLNVKIEPVTGITGHTAIQIIVSDTGPGIPKENINRIFEPFFTTDNENGTGLGLAITQRIIIAHKGKIQVESFSGGGTVFHIQFPAITTSSNKS